MERKITRLSGLTLTERTWSTDVINWVYSSPILGEIDGELKFQESLQADLGGVDVENECAFSPAPVG